MKILVENTSSRIIVGGKDNLLPVDLFKEIDDYLSVQSPGARYVKAYKKGQWDGMQRFMNKKGVFATGFLPNVISYAEELGAKIEIEDNRTNLPFLVSEKHRVWEHYKDWEARDYQQDIVNVFDNHIEYGDGNLLYWPRGIANAATNAGKNSVICCLLKNLDKTKALVLIDSQEIFDQLVEFLSVDFPRLGVINSKKFEWGDEVTIAMVRTLYSRMKKSVDIAVKVKTMFNTIVVDECHGASSTAHSEVIQNCDAGMRVMVSGSPLDNSNVINNMVILGLSGPVISTVTKKQLQDMGHSLKVKVTLHHNKTLFEGGYGDEYDEELYQGILASEERIKLIIDIVKARSDKKIMINFIEIAHGELMYTRLKEAGIDKVDWVHGTDPNRKQKLEDYKAGKIMVLISSTILKQGINVHDINALIYAQGGKALIPLKQWTGRIERNDGVSQSVEVHDFWDNGKYLEKHSRKRLNFYMEEGFEIIYNYAQKRGRPVAVAQTKLNLL